MPHKLPISDVKSVSCGQCHTIILTKVGCFGCGSNYDGQLGLGNFDYQNSFQKINLYGSCIISISCGWSHTIASTNDGIYSWGDNMYGQLGVGDYKNKNTPQKINLLGSSVTSGIISVRCGSFFTMILAEHGELFACGGVSHEHVGLGLSRTNRCRFQKINLNEFIQSVHCGRHHTIITTKSKKWYGWGMNDDGQLGLGDTKDRSEPTEIVIKI